MYKLFYINVLLMCSLAVGPLCFILAESYQPKLDHLGMGAQIGNWCVWCKTFDIRETSLANS